MQNIINAIKTQADFEAGTLTGGFDRDGGYRVRSCGITIAWRYSESEFWSLRENRRTVSSIVQADFDIVQRAIMEWAKDASLSD